MSIVPTVLNAQTAFVPQHELRLGWGLAPINYDWFHGVDYYLYRDDMFSDYYGATHDSGRATTTQAINLTYTYKPLKFMDVGAMVSYAGYFQNMIYAPTGKVDGKLRHHHISLMPTLRFTYLNRPWIRLYSGISTGVKINVFRDFLDESNFVEPVLALQVTPLGVSVGRTLFGFVELGLGTAGAINFGVGYRFNAVKKH